MTSTYFETNDMIHRFSGLWLFDKKTPSTPRKIAQNIYSLSTYGVTMCFLLLEIVMLKETVKEVAKFISHFEMLLSSMSAFMKAATLGLQHRCLRRIMDVLQKGYHHDSVGEKIFMEGRRHSQIVSTLLFGLYSFVGISAYISSKLAIDRQMKETYFPPNASCHDFLGYYFYIPFHCDTKRKCEGVILFLGVSLMVCGWIIASHDALYGALVNCLKTHFVILARAIRTIRQRVMLRLELPENFQIFHDEDFPELEEELYVELKRLTRHLIVLLEVADDIEVSFNLVLLGQVIISLVSFSSVLFVAASAPFASPEFFSQFEYFISLLIQLGVFCWFGNVIRTSSEDILYALYDCDWFSSSRRFKSTIIVTMFRMQKPVSLTFGKFCPLTINSLVSVCKSSFSYYTVFKTINE